MATIAISRQHPCVCRLGIATRTLCSLIDFGFLSFLLRNMCALFHLRLLCLRSKTFCSLCCIRIDIRVQFLGSKQTALNLRLMSVVCSVSISMSLSPSLMFNSLTSLYRLSSRLLRLLAFFR